MAWTNLLMSACNLRFRDLLVHVGQRGVSTTWCRNLGIDSVLTPAGAFRLLDWRPGIFSFGDAEKCGSESKSMEWILRGLPETSYSITTKKIIHDENPRNLSFTLKDWWKNRKCGLLIIRCQLGWANHMKDSRRPPEIDLYCQLHLDEWTKSPQ